MKNNIRGWGAHQAATMALQLRALIALAEDWGLVPSTRVGWFITLDI